MIPTKKDIAFVEYDNEASSGVAKDALHNYKLDDERKLKVRVYCLMSFHLYLNSQPLHRLRLRVNDSVL
jgi:hypothetical protein